MEVWITGTFSERFELENFPFDVQDLTMSLRFTNIGKNTHDGSEYVVWPLASYGFDCYLVRLVPTVLPQSCLAVASERSQKGIHQWLNGNIANVLLILQKQVMKNQV